MKNKRLIIVSLCVAVMGYFINTYTTGEYLCSKLQLESAQKVVVIHDNGGELNKPDNYTMTLTASQKDLLIDRIKDMRLKKHRDDYIYVSSFEVYTFDFQFENDRTKVYLYGDEFINIISTNEKYNVKYKIVK